MNRRVDKALSVVFWVPLFLLSLAMPKRKNIWLFGAWFGQRFADNSKALFEYVCDRDADIDAWWIAKTRIEAAGIYGPRVVHAYSPLGIWLQLRAKVFVSSVNAFDFLAPTMTPRSLLVQLWHGTPLKKIGLQIENKSSIQKLINRLRSKSIDRYGLVVSPGRYTDVAFQEAFAVDADRIFRAQYPRCRYLSIPEGRSQELRSLLGVDPKEKLWLYLPTHREEGRQTAKSVAAVLDLQKHSDRLRAVGHRIVMKPHFYEQAAFSGVVSTDSVSVWTELPCDLYELLGACDGLITDYSSVIADFAPLNRPIIVFPYDLEEYQRGDRQLTVDLSAVCENVVRTAGELVGLLTGGGLNMQRSGLADSFVEPGLPEPCAAIVHEIWRRLE